MKKNEYCCNNIKCSACPFNKLPYLCSFARVLKSSFSFKEIKENLIKELTILNNREDLENGK